MPGCRDGLLGCPVSSRQAGTVYSLGEKLVQTVQKVQTGSVQHDIVLCYRNYKQTNRGGLIAGHNTSKDDPRMVKTGCQAIIELACPVWPRVA